jgi:hypothetical protein
MASRITGHTIPPDTENTQTTANVTCKCSAITGVLSAKFSSLQTNLSIGNREVVVRAITCISAAPSAQSSHR